MSSETLDFVDQQRCCGARCSRTGTNGKSVYDSNGYRIGAVVASARFKFVTGESLPPDENFRRLSIVLAPPGKILVDAAALAFYTQRSLALTGHRITEPTSSMQLKRHGFALAAQMSKSGVSRRRSNIQSPH